MANGFNVDERFEGIRTGRGDIRDPITQRAEAARQALAQGQAATQQRVGRLDAGDPRTQMLRQAALAREQADVTAQRDIDLESFVNELLRQKEVEEMSRDVGLRERLEGQALEQQLTEEERVAREQARGMLGEAYDEARAQAALGQGVGSLAGAAGLAGTIGLGGGFGGPSSTPYVPAGAAGLARGAATQTGLGTVPSALFGAAPMVGGGPVAPPVGQIPFWQRQFSRRF